MIRKIFLLVLLSLSAASVASAQTDPGIWDRATYPAIYYPSRESEWFYKCGTFKDKPNNVYSGHVNYGCVRAIPLVEMVDPYPTWIMALNVSTVGADVSSHNQTEAFALLMPPGTDMVQVMCVAEGATDAANDVRSATLSILWNLPGGISEDLSVPDVSAYTQNRTNPFSWTQTATFTRVNLSQSGWYDLQPGDLTVALPLYIRIYLTTSSTSTSATLQVQCAVTDFISTGYAPYNPTPTPVPMPTETPIVYAPWPTPTWGSAIAWGTAPIVYATPSVTYELGVSYNQQASACYTLLPGYTNTFSLGFLWWAYDWEVNIPTFELCVEEYDISVQALGINWGVWAVVMLSVAGAGIWYSFIKH